MRRDEPKQENPRREDVADADCPIKMHLLSLGRWLRFRPARRIALIVGYQRPLSAGCLHPSNGILEHLLGGILRLLRGYQICTGALIILAFVQW